MKRIILSSAGDVRLTKFVFVRMTKIDGLDDQHYNTTLEGYLYMWNYIYNTLTKETDDRIQSHASVIDSLPFEIRKEFRNSLESSWGRTDVTKSGVKLYISNEGIFTKSQCDYLRNLCFQT